MKKNTAILLITSLALVLTAFKVTSAEEEVQQIEPNKSVAWYVANIKDAKIKNQQCYDDPNLKDTEDCQNALHALQISFKGGN
ncbi:EexN family lipoprotein [Methylomonas sp. HYX-M1]|uniref:EexN family lipoprotein n=1 Tax=Methylomonas sp. HYX-M1 TaxID=3139307 RepID=UPI00345B6C54